MTRILIADDNADIRESTKLLLEMLGYDVVAVERAADVLPTIKRVRPDLVLHDFHMPGLNMKEEIRQIRADPAFAKMPIILFTATLENERMWRHVGADGLLFKPFDADRVEAILADFLERRAVA